MRWTERLWRRLGRRGSALLFFGLLDLVLAYSYLFPPEHARRSASLRFTAEIAPLWLWSALWAGVGVVCLVEAWLKDDRVAFAGAISIKVVWGALYVLGAALAHLDRAYVGAAVWWALAGFVGIISSWPEPQRPSPTAKE